MDVLVVNLLSSIHPSGLYYLFLSSFGFWSNLLSLTFSLISLIRFAQLAFENVFNLLSRIWREDLKQAEKKWQLMDSEPQIVCFAYLLFYFTLLLFSVSRTLEGCKPFQFFLQNILLDIPVVYSVPPPNFTTEFLGLIINRWFHYILWWLPFKLLQGNARKFRLDFLTLLLRQFMRILADYTSLCLYGYPVGIYAWSKHGPAKAATRGVLKKKSVPKIFLSFTGKHLCWSLFLDPRPWLDGCYEFGPFRLSVRKVSLDWPINFSWNSVWY